MKIKRIVDEREVMEMYKIEHYTFWAMYALLFISIFVQLIFCGISFTQIAGEWIVFMLATIGSCYAFYKGGHFDYFLKPCMKSYLIGSLAGATVSAILYSLIIYLNLHNTVDYILCFVTIWILMFVIIFIVLYFYGEAVKKRRKELELLVEEDIDYSTKERSKPSKIGQKIFLCFTFIMAIINILLAININSNKQYDYYIARIVSMEKKDGITSVELSPMKSNRHFASEIKANHRIEYADNISISGLKEHNKEGRKLYPGMLGEEINKLIVGNSIIFKMKGYDKDDYLLEIDELAIDLTLE